jgi:hypothetical protein
MFIFVTIFNSKAMKKHYVATIAAITFALTQASAQTGLPDFSVESFGTNRTRISWTNNFGDGLIQVNVQASSDSIKDFGTVFEAVSPGLPENGYIDNKVYFGKVYYRIFYVMNGNAYYFTPSKLAEPYQEEGAARGAAAIKEKAIVIRTPFNVLARLKPKDFEKFRDSIAASTKDTLVSVNSDEMVLKYYGHGDMNSFLGYIGLNAEGYVEIKLPDAKAKKYKVVFKDNSGNHLFTINRISDPDMILDKTDFLHAGWYSFELYQDDKVIEKNRVYLQSDF